MPFIVGSFEKLLAQRGTIIAVVGGQKFTHKCEGGERGEYRLTRNLGTDGKVSNAYFICDKCSDKANVYPDGRGGVRPAILSFNGMKVEVTPGTDDGRWR